MHDTQGRSEGFSFRGGGGGMWGIFTWFSITVPETFPVMIMTQERTTACLTSPLNISPDLDFLRLSTILNIHMLEEC